jgi:predicted RNA-binding Zn-ribbon protein involved in translation (DUF1610 family)
MEEINRQISEKEYLDHIKEWKQENKKLIDSGKCRKVFLDKYVNLKNNIINWFDFINKDVYFIYEDIEDYIKIYDVKRINNRTLLFIAYKNSTDKINTDNFKKCKLGKILYKNTSKFKVEIGTIFKDEKRDITIIDRKYKVDKLGEKRKYYKYKCNLCGFDEGKHWSIKDKEYKNELWIEESNLLHHKKGCACCCLTPRVVVKDINSIYKTDPWMIPYIGEECAKTHTHSSNDRVEVTCPDCGRIKNKKLLINNIYNRHSIGCQCGDGYSHGHKYIFNLLIQLNKEFNDNYKFYW